MRLLAEIRERLRALLFREEEDRALDEEVRFHLEMETQRNAARGIDPAEARRRAVLAFGGVDRAKEEVRDARGTRWIEDLLADVRYALRRVRHAPVLAGGIALTFALGIGANAAIFGLLDHLLLRPPQHVREPDRVKRLVADRYLEFLGRRWQGGSHSYADLELLGGARAFDQVGAYSPRAMLVGHRDEAREVDAVLATHEFFSLLGVAPARGRFFTASDDVRGATPVVVLGFGFWQTVLGGDEGVLGRTLDFGLGPWTVVGIAPQGFTGIDLAPVDVWLPLRAAGDRLMGAEWFGDPTWTWLGIVGRLAPGVSADAATAEASALHRSLHRDAIAIGEYDARAHIVASPLAAERGPTATREGAVARWLGGVTMLVLIIVCANVATLLFGRAVRQQREWGIRLALGASRGRLVRQFVTEALLLALLGGFAALLVAAWGGGLVQATLFPEIAWRGRSIDGRLVAFVAALVVLTGVAAGLAPAVGASRSHLLRLVRSANRVSAWGSRTRNGLTVLQVTLSVVLLVGAGLFVKSFQTISAVDLGLDPSGVLLVRPQFEPDVPAAPRREVFARAVQRLRALPAVTHVSASAGAPFAQSRSLRVYRAGGDSVAIPPQRGPYVYAVEPDYFGALRLEIVEGRGVEAEDIEGSGDVVVVGRTMARWLWPSEPALGQCLRVGEADAPCVTVVGVAEDSRRHAIDEPPSAQYYLAAAQGLVRRTPDVLLVRVSGDAAALAPTIRRTLHALSPDIRFAEVQPMQQVIDPQVRPWRFGAALFSTLGVLALAVAAVGIYSTLALAVAQRRPELGIRTALGASPRRLVLLVLGQAGRLLGIGMGAGLVLALLAGPAVRPLLHAVEPSDPWVIGTVIGVLLAAGATAAGIPAWRAARLDPQVALRTE